MGDAVDLHKHLVKVPFVARAGAPATQLVGVGLPELVTPAPDRLVAHHDTTYQHQLLDLTKAQPEPKVQPNAVIDDLHRIAVALVRRRSGAHPTDFPRSPTLTNVTVPFSGSLLIPAVGPSRVPITLRRGPIPANHRPRIDRLRCAWASPERLPHRLRFHSRGSPVRQNG